MPFSGFGPQALPFFNALAFHQTKDWFEANRAIYDGDVKGPLGDLVEELAARFAKAKIPLKGDRKASLFRINRDVRFAKDKSPYKTNSGAVLTRSGTKNDPGLIYVHIAGEGCFAAAGFYQPEPPTSWRACALAIVRAPKAWRTMIAKLAKAGLALEEEYAMKRAPRGFEDIGEGRISPPPCATSRSSARARSRRRGSRSQASSMTSSPSRGMPRRHSSGAGAQWSTRGRTALQGLAPHPGPLSLSARGRGVEPPSPACGRRWPEGPDEGRGRPSFSGRARRREGVNGGNEPRDSAHARLPYSSARCARRRSIRWSCANGLEFISIRWRATSPRPRRSPIMSGYRPRTGNFQHVFKRWAGLTPEAFLQAITIERARERLRDFGERAGCGL